MATQTGKPVSRCPLAELPPTGLPPSDVVVGLFTVETTTMMMTTTTTIADPSLQEFELAQAGCFDLNEEFRLRRVIAGVGVDDFNAHPPLGDLQRSSSMRRHTTVACTAQVGL